MFQLFSKKLNISECLKRYFVRTHADCLLAPRTIKKYEEVGKRWLDLMGDMNVKKINDEYVTQLKQKLNELKSSPSRKNHFMIVIRNLLVYLEQHEHIKVYDHKQIAKFKVPQKEVTFLTKEQLIRLINAPDEKNITGIRLKALILSLISTGCRISELIGINRDDINYETGIISIRTKGDKPHRIIFNPVSLECLKKYLEMRTDACEALFATANSNNPKRWQVSDCERTLRKFGQKLGYKINVTPHLIGRRSVATLMYKENVPLGVIQAFLNHSSAQVTTKFYIGSLNFDEVKKNHDRVMNFTGEGGDEP